MSIELRKEFQELNKQKDTKSGPDMWDVPIGFKMQTGGKKVKKPGASVNWVTLRQFAEFYPIAQACIRYLKSHITKLEWDIGSVEKDKDISNRQKDIQQIKDWFKKPMGHKTRLRELLAIIVEDVSVLDAVSLYKRQTFGGSFLSLRPIDPGTIKLKVTDFGGTPEPPEVAYEQWIRGKKVADMTTDEMIYEMMSPRSDNAYGRAPLESLVIEVESALRNALFNLKYLEEGNDPEGFGVLPEGWTREQIKEWQDYWDAMITGNMAMRRRMKWVPAGFSFEPSKKIQDMAFEKFELWLMEKTTAIFGVPPEEIGFTHKINKSTGEVQKQGSKDRGLYPLAMFIKEIFDEIIQEDLGFTDLAWLWPNIDPTDEKEEAEIFKILVGTGAKSVDEYRREKGLEEIGLEHYVETPSGPLLVEDIKKGNTPLMMNPMMNPKPGDDDEKEKQKKDIKRWMKCCVADLKKGKSEFRKFDSEFITDEIRDDIEKYLGQAEEVWQIKKVFEPFLSDNAKIVGKVANLRHDLEDIINSHA